MSNKLPLFVRSLPLALGLLAFSPWQPVVHAQDRVFFHRPGPPGGMMGDGPGMMLPMMLKKLNLTPEQDARVQEIMGAHKDTFKSLFTQLKTAHEDMAGRFFAPGSLTAADLASQTTNVKQLREQLMNEGIKVALEVREVLTPEQLAKGEELRKKMEAMHEQMRSMMEDEE
ncbi:MAG: periplasmic heavy metal sensor [Deltaproteobacteria bacterium]|nr:periplasmic heavy metal sensor [Deltaproteobacteria bacterium]